MPEPIKIQLHTLCGGCQQHGVNPDLKNGICQTCGRTKEHIEELHGIVQVTSPLPSKQKPILRLVIRIVRVFIPKLPIKFLRDDIEWDLEAYTASFVDRVRKIRRKAGGKDC